ncbi:MAG: hypothetical protein PVH68_00450 [Armatimonadota bacterium]
MVRGHGLSYSGLVAIMLAGAFVVSLCGAAAWGDPRTRLINIDTARVLEDRQWQYGIDLRAFGSADDGTYGSGHIRCVKHGYQLEALGALSQRATHDTGSATLRYGGTNVEVRAKKRLLRGGKATLSAIAGLEFPNTPAQDDVHFALHLPLTIDGSQTSGHIVPKFVFLNDNTVSSLGLGIEHVVNDRLTLMGELTPNLDGANTRSSSGELTDDTVWGVGFRWTPCDDGDWTIDFGLTNGKGQTSSFAAAPGILDSTAFYVAATCTR